MNVTLQFRENEDIIKLQINVIFEYACEVQCNLFDWCFYECEWRWAVGVLGEGVPPENEEMRRTSLARSVVCEKGQQIWRFLRLRPKNVVYKCGRGHSIGGCVGRTSDTTGRERGWSGSLAVKEEELDDLKF